MVCAREVIEEEGVERGDLKEVSDVMLKLIPLASVCGVGFSLRISSEPQIE